MTELLDLLQPLLDRWPLVLLAFMLPLGIALVIVIMIGYYRFSGVLAVAGLAFAAARLT